MTDGRLRKGYPVVKVKVDDIYTVRWQLQQVRPHKGRRLISHLVSVLTQP